MKKTMYPPFYGYISRLLIPICEQLGDTLLAAPLVLQHQVPVKIFSGVVFLTFAELLTRIKRSSSGGREEAALALGSSKASKLNSLGKANRKAEHAVLAPANIGA
jgi:hypothetical protein